LHNSKLEWLAHYIIQNRLLIYASPDLLAEIKKVIHYPKIKKLLNAPASNYIDIITALILVKKDIPIVISSPDPDDDYLFDLAKFADAKVIICGDKLLLNWKESPVKMMSKKEFEELY